MDFPGQVSAYSSREATAAGAGLHPPPWSNSILNLNSSEYSRRIYLALEKYAKTY
jgi:hypothetical protein